MPSIFAAVSPRVWDATLRRASTNARLVRAYIATCPSKTTEGLFRLNVGYIAADTGLKPDDVEDALAELDNAGLIRWDPENEVVLDFLALEAANINKSGDNRIVGALKQLRSVGHTSLHDVFLAHVESVCPVLAEAIRESEPRKALTRPRDAAPFGQAIDSQNPWMN